MPETTFSTTYVLGLLSAALDARSSTGRVLYPGSPGFEETGSTPGVSGYGWLRNLTRTGTGYVSSASTQNDPATFTTSGWPVMVGSQTKLSESGPKWRVITY